MQEQCSTKQKYQKRPVKIGQRFGMLVAVRFVPAMYGRRGTEVECVCDCGNTTIRSRHQLHSNATPSCGCYASIRASRIIREYHPNLRAQLQGRRFGRLVAMEDVGANKDGQRMWLCQCDCGGTITTRATQLLRGGVQSCGCLALLVQNATHTKHGKGNTSIYSRWRGMLTRCYNTRNKAYPKYGGRGIKVCERWHDFNNFYEDVGDPPEGLTLDRENVDGDYEPSNVRWADWSTQRRNQRRMKHDA